MLEIIRNLLLKLADDISSGNTNLTEAECMVIISTIQGLARKDEGISKYAACEYLNISRATFDRYVSDGKLPKGKHVQGFKELRWFKKDLDRYIKKNE